MAKETTNKLDTNFNMRARQADLDAFGVACRANNEPNVAAVVRRLMADYTAGNISYSPRVLDVPIEQAG